MQVRILDADGNEVNIITVDDYDFLVEYTKANNYTWEPIQPVEPVEPVVSEVEEALNILTGGRDDELNTIGDNGT